MAIKVSHIDSIKRLLESLEVLSPESEMYRGQTRDWPLIPSIGRYPKIVLGYDDWRGLHKSIVEEFLRLSRPYLSSIQQNTSDNWILAQHHGLPTRLLDTSTNPLKALFFSVSKPEEDNYDGVFWAFSFSSFRKDLDDKHEKYWQTEFVPFFPAQVNPRLTAQEGAFVSYPLPANRKPLRPLDKLPNREIQIDKFIVPAKSKVSIRRELFKLGIQFRFLFPDLEGVARSIKLSMLHDQVA